MTHEALGGDGLARDLGPGLGRVVPRSATLFADAPLRLERGGALRPIEVAYETYGELAPERDNVVVVCHALTGDAHAAGHHGDPGRRGWWDVLIGPGRALDTERFHVVSTNLLGGCSGTTGPSSPRPAAAPAGEPWPGDRRGAGADDDGASAARAGEPYGLDFPALTVGDLVRVQRELLRTLGIERVHAVVGGSLGGMQALEWSLQAPGEVANVVAVASSAALGAQNIALSTAAREAILRDPGFQGGRYHGTGRLPTAGLAAARMLGHVTYLSEGAMDEKFGRRRRDPDAPPAVDGHGWLRPDFEVEHYLHHQAESFLRRFDPLTYLYLTRVMDHHEPFARPDADARQAASSAAGTRHLIAGFTSDWRFGTAHADHLERELRARGAEVVRREIDAPFGHDSFLLPVPAYLDAVGEFVGAA